MARRTQFRYHRPVFDDEEQGEEKKTMHLASMGLLVLAGMFEGLFGLRFVRVNCFVAFACLGLSLFLLAACV